jgi:hypothetical protein
MNRSVSAREFKQPSRSPSCRVIYMNKETNKREVSTPFHSPYKDGRRNPNYQNPSFISSELFYAAECTTPNQSTYRLTSNVIPNRNDLKQAELMNKRLEQQKARSKSPQPQPSPKKTTERLDRSRDFSKGIPKKKILRNNEPEHMLRN